MEKTFSIEDIVRLLISRIWVIVLGLVIGGAGVFLISKLAITPQYSSAVTMIVNKENTITDANGNKVTTVYGSTNAADLIKTYSIVVKSNTVLEPVAEQLGLGYSPEELRSMFSLSSVDNTEVFQIKVNNSNPEHAAKIANAIADIAPDEIIRSVKAGSVEIIDRATVAASPSSPNNVKNGMIGALVGLVVALLIVFVSELFNKKVRSEQDLVSRFKYPILGSIPNFELNS